MTDDANRQSSIEWNQVLAGARALLASRERDLAVLQADPTKLTADNVQVSKDGLAAREMTNNAIRVAKEGVVAARENLEKLTEKARASRSESHE